MESTDIGIKEIIDLIPHRYPFLLVDKVIDFVKDKSATGIKCVTMNEQFFTGHFPGNPVMPGVLIIEALAQTSAVLAAKSLGAKPGEKGVLFTTINNVKFRKSVVPGDKLELKVEIVKSKMSLWMIKGEAFVDGKKVVQGEFSAMIFNRK